MKIGVQSLMLINCDALRLWTPEEHIQYFIDDKSDKLACQVANMDEMSRVNFNRTFMTCDTNNDDRIDLDEVYHAWQVMVAHAGMSEPQKVQEKEKDDVVKKFMMTTQWSEPMDRKTFTDFFIRYMVAGTRMTFSWFDDDSDERLVGREAWKYDLYNEKYYEVLNFSAPENDAFNSISEHYLRKFDFKNSYDILPHAMYSVEANAFLLNNEIEKGLWIGLLLQVFLL